MHNIEAVVQLRRSDIRTGTYERCFANIGWSGGFLPGPAKLMSESRSPLMVGSSRICMGLCEMSNVQNALIQMFVKQGYSVRARADSSMFQPVVTANMSTHANVVSGTHNSESC